MGGMGSSYIPTRPKRERKLTFIASTSPYTVPPCSPTVIFRPGLAPGVGRCAGRTPHVPAR